MPKVYNVRVSTLEAELEFTIQQTTTVKQVFDQTVKTIGLREVWYFGLAYTDVNNERAWMNLDKKVLSHDIKPENPLQLRFRAKFYPEDAGSELIQDVTKRLFYLQAKEAIINDEVYCAPDTAVLLASYACQVKYGDRKNASITLEQLAKDRLLPSRVLEQHQLSPLEWATRIGGWWVEHGLMLREDAIVEYLKVAQDLEMFGVTYFDIRNKRGTALLLGIDSLGLNIYDRNDKLTPKIGFAWSDLGGIAVSKKKFVIKASDKKTGDFTMFTSHERITKRVAALCLGNHELYLRRRQQDAIEVQQMKAQAREERLFREQERVKLEMEAKRREEAERERQALETRLRELEDRAGDAQRSAEVAAAQLLAIQNEYEAAMRQREEADQAREQAEALRRQLEETVTLEQEERKRLNEEYETALRAAEIKEEEVRAKEAELNATRSELDTIRVAIEQRAAEQAEREQLEAERLRLEAELRAAASELQRAREEEEARVAAELERRQQLAKIAIVATVAAERQQSRSDEVDEVVQKIEAAPRPQAAAVQQAALAELFDAKMSNAFSDGKDDGEIQLTATNGNLPQTEIERVPEVKSDVALNQKLRELREELQQSRDDRKVVQNDILHAENQRQGRDKFKTLKQIRQGNTKKRVDEFESM